MSQIITGVMTTTSSASVAFLVPRSVSSRTLLIMCKSGEIMWCRHVNMEKKLREVFLTSCEIHSSKNWGSRSTKDEQRRREYRWAQPGSNTVFLEPTQPFEAVWCNRWVLTPLINSSEDAVHTLTFSFPLFPPLYPSTPLSLPLTHSLCLARSLILQLYHTFSISLTHTHAASYHFRSLASCISCTRRFLSAQTHTSLSLSLSFAFLLPPPQSLSVAAALC